MIFEESKKGIKRINEERENGRDMQEAISYKANKKRDKEKKEIERAKNRRENKIKDEEVNKRIIGRRKKIKREQEREEE
jgi:hypothetical protein